VYCGGNLIQSLTYGKNSYLTKWSEKTITDQVIDLSGMTRDQRKAFFSSRDYAMWRCKTFKNVNNFDVDVNLVEYPAENHYTDFNPTRCSGRLETGDGLATHGADAAYELREPVSFLLHSDSFKNRTGVADVDFSEFIRKASADAALLGSESFSVANFLAELRDFKQLLKLFKTDFSDPIRLIAEVNLSWNFGVAPFVGDIVAMYDIALNLQNRIDKWNKMADDGILMNQHKRSRANMDPFTFSESWTDPVGGAFSNGTVSANVSFATRYHIYYLPVRIPTIDMNDIFFSVLGLRDPANIIWEAIPWSFLVDWVYNVSDIIDAWTAKDPVIKMEIMTFGYSRSLDMSVESTGTSVRRDYNYSSDTTPLSLGKYTGTYTAYERYTIPVENLPETNPIDVGEFQLSDFGLKRASLVASLVVVLT
jgi:hypothetical protein